MSTRTPPSVGEVVATNIAAHMTRLGWEFDQLAEATGIPWGDLVHHRADAESMTMAELAAVAEALGVSPATLCRLP